MRREIVEWTDLLCALALDGDEQASTLAPWIAQRCGEVRAAHHADLDVVVLDERETDSVLLAEEETLGAVDRIEGPHACRSRTCNSITDPIRYMVHLRPLGPPGWFPRSIAVRSESMERRGAEGPTPHAGSSPALRGARSASFTRDVRRSRSAFAVGESARRSAESSSAGIDQMGIDGRLCVRRLPTTGSPGNAL